MLRVPIAVHENNRDRPVALVERSLQIAPRFFDIQGHEHIAARADTRGLRATLALAPGEATADAALLLSVLNNLFDNAVHYAPAGGEVRITGGPAAASGYTLRCANLAPTLTADDVERLFDRFWRKDAARTGEGRHVGIGLNLARQLAEATNWRLTAQLEPGDWLVFTLATGIPATRG